MYRAINVYFACTDNKKTLTDITMYKNLHSLNIQQTTIARE